MPRSLALLCLPAAVLLAVAPGAAADEGPTGGAAAPSTTAAPSAAGGGTAYRKTARRRPGNRRLRRSRPAHRRPARSPVRRPRSHRFPVGGPFSYGGPDARFGAGRKTRLHQGQDLTAAEGTPVLAPWDGQVKAVQYQASGAGHYVVLDGAGEERDYVFMHLRTGSIPVREGQLVRAGQRIGEVGNTGRSSGAHLHFEIWTGRGWFSGGDPVDPLPLLRAWERP